MAGMGSDPEWKAARKKLYVYRNKMLELQYKNKLLRLTMKTNKAPNSSAEMENNSSWLEAFGTCSTPLQNEYLLEMIASYLPIQDLRNCQLVCKFWGEEMSRCLQQRKMFIATDENNQEAIDMLNARKRGIFVNISTLCLFDISSSGRFFRRLMYTFGSTLSGIKFEECNISTLDLADTLLRRAPNVESLSVIEKEANTEDLLSPFCAIRNTNRSFVLPKLKRLQWEERVGRVALEDIILACPNLIELYCSNLHYPLIYNYENLQWNSLRFLKLSPLEDLHEEWLDALTMLNLNLKKLTLFGMKLGGKSYVEKVKKLLHSVADSLEEVHLYQTYIPDPPNAHTITSYPLVLPKLKTFIIDCDLFSSFKVLNDMPMLETLECKLIYWKNWETVIQNGSPRPHRRLKKISVGTIDPVYLPKIAKFFPVLTNLELDGILVDDKAFRIIVTKFRCLQTLKMLGSTNKNMIMPLTDSGITGIPIKVCEKLLKDKNYLSINEAPVRKFPFVGNLKNLTKFEIDSTQSKLTDLSILFGIVHLEKILLLVLPKCQITSSSLEAMKTSLKLVSIVQVYESPHMTHEAIADFQKARKEVIVRTCSI